MCFISWDIIFFVTSVFREPEAALVHFSKIRNETVSSSRINVKKKHKKDTYPS